MGEHGIRNPDGLNDLRKDGEVVDLGFVEKIGIVSSGVRVIRWFCIAIVKGIGLFNGEVLRYLTKMTLTHSVPLNTHISQKFI